MITNCTQRWRARRAVYRPRGEPIRTSDYDVVVVPDDTTARAFIERHHYLRGFPSARRRYGLQRGDELVGVAVFSTPVRQAVVSELPERELAADGKDARCELGRFCLLDEVPANGESWFLARCFELLKREGFVGVVSFSDPLPRTSADGTVTHPGHVGTIYQASNATYIGQRRKKRVALLPDGTGLEPRSASKVAAEARGASSVFKQLSRNGATPLRDDEDACAWVDRWIQRLARIVPHPGNHKYVWAFDRHVRLPTSQPYPKLGGFGPLWAH